MTKTIIFTTAIFLSVFFSRSFGMNHRGDTLSTIEAAGITTLIINADINIVLVNKEKASMDIAVEPSLRKFVTVIQSGDTLLINPVQRKQKAKGGVMYVPANQLRKIQINSEAYVRSFSRLQIPKLDVIINGACNFKISNIGEVHVVETDIYTVEQTTEVHHWPAGIFTHRKI